MDRIGFIGLGIMGGPMAKNLLKVGYSLTVLDINPQSVDELVKAGATSAEDPCDVARESDIVITMLPDSPDVEKVVLGEEGVIQGIKEGALFIDMSTIAPAMSIKIYEALQDKNVQSLDAPVSGGYMGAENGTLSIMIGGDRTAFDRAFPVFQTLGKNIVYMGETGAGQVTKTCNQIIVGVTLQAVSEALTLAKAAEVDLNKVRQALLGGFAQSKVLDHQGERIIEGNFEPGFKLKLHRKDLNISLETGKEQQVPLPCTAIVAQLMDAGMAQGFGESDHTTITKIFKSTDRA
ncbi:2-hydroxy-3-oxopropionate reductase [candidate division KSB1 bacterium]|nr:2-hydroxy-3-oxopropionate reductase [candidate division KSB1 bacterium]